MKSTIEWTDFTFNPWEGCMKVSAGCANCYAETRNARFGGGIAPNWGPNSERLLRTEDYWKAPVKWNRAAEKEGVRRRVFCASLADVFEDNEQIVAPRLRLFEMMRVTPHLDWLLLTKRPENIKASIERVWRSYDASKELRVWTANWLEGFPPANVWLGTSVEDERQLKRVQYLTAIAAAVHFLSCEPLLGHLDLHLDRNGHTLSLTIGQEVDWVICGGESGPNARPMESEWAQSLRDQCVAANVPFHFKQWGEHFPLDQWEYSPHLVIANPDEPFAKVGKKNAGRLLDGVEWNQFPEVKP